MKSSQRNVKNAATKAAARLGGPPKISKYAAKLEAEQRRLSAQGKKP